MSTGVARETRGASVSLPGDSVAHETGIHVAHEDCSRHPGVARETAATGTSAPRLPARIALAPLRLYRRRLSPLLGARCRYYPSCSAYAEQAVVELGLFKGFVIGLWRLLRCNPLSPGGLDPLESRRLFRSEGAGADAERREVGA